MIAPRWLKAFRDLGANRGRTALVVLAIAVGVFGVGSMLVSYAVLMREMRADYLSTEPASAILHTGPLDAEALAAVRRVPGVATAEERGEARVRIEVGPDEYRDMKLFVVPDFRGVRVSTFHRQTGAFPPHEGAILVERAAMPLLRASVGDTITLRSAERLAHLELAGTVHDPGLAPAWMENEAYGFVTPATAARLGAHGEGSTLLVSTRGEGLDEAGIRRVASDARRALEQQGVRVASIEVPEPGRHPHAGQLEALLYLLGAFGVLALGLGAALAGAMVSAMLARQVREIGVLKAIGATTAQVGSAYLGSVLLLGLVAALLAVPLASAAGRGYAGMVAGILNFDIADESIPAWVLLTQLTVGLLAPLIAAAVPLRRGARVTVREAIADQGLSARAGGPWSERFLRRIPGLDRLTLLSIRNAFRRPGRLALVLITLTLAGAGFMAALDVAASWDRTIEQAYAAWRYDLDIQFASPLPIATAERVAGSAPTATYAEGFAVSSAVVRQGAGDGATVQLLGVKPETRMLRLPLLAGRWLRGENASDAVVNSQLLDRQPGLAIGSPLVLATADGRTIRTTVVGVVREIAPPRAFVPLAVSAGPLGGSQLVNAAFVQSRGHDETAQRQAVRSLERALDAEGISAISVTTTAERERVLADHIVVLVSLLVVMSGLIAAVGALALASMMSVGVMERMREVGVLQTIGATSSAVFRSIVVEGIAIAALSCLFATVVSWPLALLVGNTAGLVFINSPLQMVPAPAAGGLWVVLAIVLGAASSVYPAWSASRLTVRQILSYR